MIRSTRSLAAAASSMRWASTRSLAHRLLEVDVPSVARAARRRRRRGAGSGSSASTASTARPLAASSPTDANVRASGQSCCRCAAALVARVDQRDHLDVGVVDVGAYVQVVDASEADERGAHRPLVRRERQLPAPGPNDGVGSCCSSTVLPGGIVDPDLHHRLVLHAPPVLDATRLELGDGGVEIGDRQAVVVAGRVDRGAEGRGTHQVELEVADALPGPGYPGDLGPGHVGAGRTALRRTRSCRRGSRRGS